MLGRYGDGQDGQVGGHRAGGHGVDDGQDRGDGGPAVIVS